MRDAGGRQLLSIWKKNVSNWCNPLLELQALLNYHSGVYEDNHGKNGLLELETGCKDLQGCMQLYLDMFWKVVDHVEKPIQHLLNTATGAAQ